MLKNLLFLLKNLVSILKPTERLQRVGVLGLHAWAGGLYKIDPNQSQNGRKTV